MNDNCGCGCLHQIESDCFLKPYVMGELVRDLINKYVVCSKGLGLTVCIFIKANLMKTRIHEILNGTQATLRDCTLFIGGTGLEI